MISKQFVGFTFQNSFDKIIGWYKKKMKILSKICRLV